MSLLLSGSTSVMNYLIPVLVKNPIGVLLAYLGLMVAGLFIMYFSIRITLVLIVTVFDIIHGEARSVGVKYKSVGQVIWKYIGASLLIGLICLGIYIGFALVAAIIGGATAVLDGSRMLLIVLLSIMGTCVVGLVFYIMVKLNMSLLVRVFKPHISNYFEYSKELVKGHSWKVFALYMTPALIQIPIIGIIMYLMMNGTINNWVYMGSIYLSSLILTPLFTTAYVVMYLLLEKKLSDQTMEDSKGEETYTMDTIVIDQ